MEGRIGLIIILFIYSIYIPREVCSKDENKRILVNDDSYLHSLQIDMQNMKASLAELTSKLSHQEIQFAIENASLATKIAGLQSTVNDLSNKYFDLLVQNATRPSYSDLATKYGSMYIRWGRKQCPANGTSLVYSGFSGGSYYSGSGPADFLCMPPDPIYEANAKTEGSAYVYGVEYETTAYGSTRVNDDMPCSVCQTSRANVIMLPGRNQCHDGWTLEYHGWLAGGSSDHASSQYICLDIHPESLQHGVSDENGRLLYLVKSECGSLPCPPYQNGKTLSCAVCSM